MTAAAKTISTPPEPSPGQIMRVEDRIMTRALALWRRKEHGHPSAPDAWLQAKREILPQKGEFPRSVNIRPSIKTD